jgi:SAM-dependent methyltransferase
MLEQQGNGAEGLIGEGRRLLDETYQQIHRDPLAISHTISTLFDGLHKTRRQMPREVWQSFCKNVASKHGLAEFTRQDPFTLHSERKPRGYAGDAALLDYIYGYREVPTTAVGRSIFEYTTGTTVSQAVRNRAQRIAGIIDHIVNLRGSARVLSIACGHLREADMSQAVGEGRNVEYVALDQDTESLAYVNERLRGKNVRTVEGSVVDLLRGKHKDLEGFDLVYAAGLYDYLSQKVATRMTSWMFNATRPGGITLLTNFVHDVLEAGYMEAFMQWELIFRSPEELVDTARRIPADQIAATKTYVEDGAAVVFVELHKASRLRIPADAAFRPMPHREEVLHQSAEVSHTMGT